MLLGEILKRRRENIPMSLAEASRQLGLSKPGLRAIELCDRKPCYDTLCSMVRVYRMDPRTLFKEVWRPIADTQNSLTQLCLELNLSLPTINQLCGLVGKEYGSSYTHSTFEFFGLLLKPDEVAKP